MATPAAHSNARPAIRAPVQLAAAGVGAAFLLVGILGFVPGMATDHDVLSFAGQHGDEAKLLGLFTLSTLQHIVHLVFGVAGLAMARTFNAARLYLVWGAATYVLAFLYGTVIDYQTAVSPISVNTTDTWLHVGPSIGMLGFGLLLGRSESDEAENEARAAGPSQ